MSSSVTYHFTTAASTNLQPVGAADQGGTVKGYAFNNAAGANALKFYWTNTQPTVGTTVPNYSELMASSAVVVRAFPDGITGNGQLWVAVTGAIADSDSTNGTAAAVVTLLLE
jgi:hypothetical protein